MNFIESKDLKFSTDGILPLFGFYFSLFTLFAVFIGSLDVLLTFGAYTTARGMAISRIVIRFFWWGLSSVFVTYVYV